MIQSKYRTDRSQKKTDDISDCQLFFEISTLYLQGAPNSTIMQNKIPDTGITLELFQNFCEPCESATDNNIQKFSKTKKVLPKIL